MRRLGQSLLKGRMVMRGMSTEKREAGRYLLLCFLFCFACLCRRCLFSFMCFFLFQILCSGCDLVCFSFAVVFFVQLYCFKLSIIWMEPCDS